MKVVLSCDALEGGLSGLGVALRGFLSKASDLDVADSISLLSGVELTGKVEREFQQLVIPRVSLVLPGFVWSQYSVPSSQGLRDFDLLHWTNQILPPVRSPIPSVVSVWDIAHLHFRERGVSQMSSLFKYSFLLKAAVRNAARVICHSNFVANEVADRFGVRPDDISVVYPALDEKFKQEASTSSPRNERKHILYVGTTQKRKNLDFLLDAYSRLKGSVGDVKLVLRCYFDDHDLKILHNRLRQLGIPESCVEVIGKASVQELVQLYKDSYALAFPSLYEGFGLPILEALEVGVPVIALDKGTMREVVGDAGILVDESSPDEFADALRTVILDSGTRDETVERARSRARSFDWKTSVEQTFSVYQSI